MSMQIEIFNSTTDIREIKYYFDNTKKPFVIKNVINNKIDLQYLDKYFGDQNVTFLNNHSEKEDLQLTEFINKINSGAKYRLRANTKIGNQIVDHIDTRYIEQIKNKKKRFLDYLLSFGKTSRQHTLFLSTKDCVFAKHAHITSGLIIQLHESKI